MQVVNSVTHSLCFCPPNNDLRSDMVTKLCWPAASTCAPRGEPRLMDASTASGTPRGTGRCRSGRSQLPHAQISVQAHPSRSCSRSWLKRNKCCRMWLLTIIVRYRPWANVSFTMSHVADWRSNVSSKTQRRNLGEDRGVQLWLGLGNREAHMACVVHDARD